MKVSIITFGDLPSDVAANASNNGRGKKYANYIRIDYEDGNIKYFSDAMEGEDALFSRSLSWIKGELEAAFEAGMRV